MKNIVLAKMGNTVIPVIGAALSVFLVLVWWYGIRDSAPNVTHVTGFKEGHRSIESLSDAADLVIVGAIEGVAGREPYYTGQTDDDIAVPMVFYEVSVSERLQGSSGYTIIVAQTDNSSTDLIVSESGTPLEPGERLLLFLLHMDGEVYGLEKFRDVDDLYVIVSDDNGMFEISSNDTAIPREPYLFRAPGEDEMPEFTMDEIRASLVNESPGGDDSDAGDLITEEPLETPVSVNE